MKSFSALNAVLAIVVLFLSTTAQTRADPPKPRFKAVAFDYLVIFDPGSIIPDVEKEFPGKGLTFSRAWQAKQLEYVFLRTIANRHVDFFKVVGDALDQTASAMKLRLSPEARARLLNSYRTLRPWPDVVENLKRLRASGLKIIVLSNFSPYLIRANAVRAGLRDLFDDLLSTEQDRTFKPDPRAYELALKGSHYQKHEVLFVASAGWDAYGAKSFGYPTFWVNRSGAVAEKLGVSADRKSNDLEGVVEFVLGTSKEK